MFRSFLLLCRYDNICNIYFASKFFFITWWVFFITSRRFSLCGSIFNHIFLMLIVQHEIFYSLCHAHSSFICFSLCVILILHDFLLQISLGDRFSTWWTFSQSSSFLFVRFSYYSIWQIYLGLFQTTMIKITKIILSLIDLLTEQIPKCAFHKLMCIFHYAVHIFEEATNIFHCVFFTSDINSFSLRDLFTMDMFFFTVPKLSFLQLYFDSFWCWILYLLLAWKFFQVNLIVQCAA